ncbi:MAG: type II toxin-antitoxin system RelE/ParE family toxin [Candidatus Korobacteraceae bacterium]
MKLRWTPRAVTDLEEISDYLMVAAPQAWRHLLKRLERLTDALLDFPLMGKAGLVKGTREFVLAGTPYILVFQLKDDAIVIVSVRDGRMRMPPGQ